MAPELNDGLEKDSVTSTTQVTADERRREQERVRKARQRERERAEAGSVGNKAGGQVPPVPPKEKPAPNPFSRLRQKFATKVGDPVGPTEARRQLWHIHVGLAKIIRSHAVLVENDFEEAGNAFEEVANRWVPWLRIILRIGAPLILLGALWTIWAHILAETPWLQDWWAQRRAPRVVPEPDRPPPTKDPFGGEPSEPANSNGAEDAHPPSPNMYRLRGR